MSRDKNTQELLTLALTLATVIKNIFKERGKIRFSREPVIEKKSIVEFRQRMRIFSEEKFDGSTIISNINYYADDYAMHSHNALGALVIFIEKDYVQELMRRLKYPEMDDDDDESTLDACGTVCNLIAGRFKAEITKLGYADLIMSHFSNYLNTAYEGIEFSNEQLEKYVVSFYIEGIKRIVVEMTMDAIPASFK